MARSSAFRRRYWSGLYICKAIEVMHRRLLGRPTFGRWEIDAYFDMAARTGFYGVVDAMLNSNEYATAFGEDTVPYERFITPTDLNTRRVPALKRELVTSAVDLLPGSRPDVPVPADFRFSGELTARNLSGRSAPIRGDWRLKVVDDDHGFSSSQPAVPEGPGSIKADPEPSRRWSAPRWQPGGGVTTSWPPKSAKA